MLSYDTIVKILSSSPYISISKSTKLESIEKNNVEK